MQEKNKGVASEKVFPHITKKVCHKRAFSIQGKGQENRTKLKPTQEEQQYGKQEI